jgi:hypothetical protein
VVARKVLTLTLLAALPCVIRAAGVGDEEAMRLGQTSGAKEAGLAAFTAQLAHIRKTSIS